MCWFVGCIIKFLLGLLLKREKRLFLLNSNFLVFVNDKFFVSILLMDKVKMVSEIC